MKRKPIDERIEVVNGQLAVIHVYPAKIPKDEEIIAARDDSRQPVQRWMQWEHGR